MLQLKYDTKPTASYRRKRSKDILFNRIVYAVTSRNLYWETKANKLRARFEKWR
jgi:hypothetical protein